MHGATWGCSRPAEARLLSPFIVAFAREIDCAIGIQTQSDHDASG